MSTREATTHQARILDGHVLARQIERRVKDEVARLAREGERPHLVSVLVGEHAGAVLYTRHQRKACRKVGIRHTLYEFEAGTPERSLVAHIRSLNANPDVTGIIVQLPLPEDVDPRRVQCEIDPTKDVEGVHPANLGRVLSEDPELAPCTALAAFELIRATGVQLRGAEAVVVGHSEIVGKPMALLLLKEMATVTVCHIATIDLAAHTRRADILVVAAGRPDLIHAEHVKPGAVVIDVGINQVPGRNPDGSPASEADGTPIFQTVGDVDFCSVAPIASAISPVPGGVGPMTVAMLLRNTVAVAEARARP